MPHCEYTLSQRRKGKKTYRVERRREISHCRLGNIVVSFGEGTRISMCRLLRGQWSFVAWFLSRCKGYKQKTTYVDGRKGKKKLEGRQKMGSFVRHNVHHSSPDIHPFMWQFFSICILISLLLVPFLHPISSYLLYILPDILSAFSTPTSHFLLLFSYLLSSYSADDCLLTSFLSRCIYILL